MQRTGTLHIDDNSGVSRLDTLRLIKGANDNGGFDRATNFLQEKRDLEDNDPIFAEGDDDTFSGSGGGKVFIITEAGRLVVEMAMGGSALRRSNAKKAGKKNTKEKAATRKPAVKKATNKKSAKKNPAPKK